MPVTLETFLWKKSSLYVETVYNSQTLELPVSTDFNRQPKDSVLTSAFLFIATNKTQMTIPRNAFIS